MKRPTLDIVTMGCYKNLVDTERLLAQCDAAGLKARHNPPEGVVPSETVVINTCGFIQDAKEESIDTILRYIRSRNLQGLPRRIYVMGCLSQRYARDLPGALPEVDGWYGKFDWGKILDDISETVPTAPKEPWKRRLTGPRHRAYLKISEGCNRRCAFCAIPLITGPMRSRPMEEILDEARWLVSEGVKEINVIAQDLSAYGTDLYGHQALAELVDKMADIEGLRWIRLHYFYPAGFPEDILDVMARRPNVCRYIDIALQHIDDGVLSNMRRHITAEETRALIARMRQRVPGVHLRTTVMTGFPGEDEDAFLRLKDFVKETRFERLGGFAYSEEEGTWGATKYVDDIPLEVKQRRLDEIMALQEAISLEVNEAKVGQLLRVIIDGENEDYYIGRSEWDSPEVDPEILVEKTRKLTVGEFYDVTITEAMPYELIARP